MLRHADAEPLLYLRAYSRRTHHRGQPGGGSAGNLQADGPSAALAPGSRSEGRRVRDGMVQEGLKKASTDDGGR